MNPVAKAHHRRVLAAMTRAGGADDLVLRGRQESLLRDFLQPAFVVVIRPRLHIDQAAAEQAVGGAVALVEKDRPDDGLERVRQDRLQRAGAGLMSPLSQQEIVAQAERSEERRVGKECRSRWSPYH